MNNKDHLVGQLTIYVQARIPVWQIWLYGSHSERSSWVVVKMGIGAPPIQSPILLLRIDPCWHITSKLSLHPHLAVNCPHMVNWIRRCSGPNKCYRAVVSIWIKSECARVEAEIDLCTTHPAPANDPQSLYDLVLVRLETGHSELQSRR